MWRVHVKHCSDFLLEEGARRREREKYPDKQRRRGQNTNYNNNNNKNHTENKSKGKQNTVSNKISQVMMALLCPEK